MVNSRIFWVKAAQTSAGNRPIDVWARRSSRRLSPDSTAPAWRFFAALGAKQAILPTFARRLGGYVTDERLGGRLGGRLLTRFALVW